MASLTSDQVNFLIYRYLLESGFVHSAFAFGHESFVGKSQIDSKQVPPGALISFIQKGLQYVEMEAHVNEDGTENICDASFSVSERHQCSSSEKRQIFEPYEPIEMEFGELEINDDEVISLKGHREMVTLVRWSPVGGVVATGSTDNTIRIWDVEYHRRVADGLEDDDMQDEDASNGIIVCLQSSEDVKSSDEKEDATATKRNRTKKQKKSKKSAKVQDADSTTGDATSVSEQPAAKKRRTTGHSVPSTSNDTQDTDRSIVCGEWNAKGTRFASGDYAGCVIIWTDKGQCEHQLHRHEGPIASLRWNGRGNYLLSCGIDGLTILWDVARGMPKHILSEHNGPVLDCDWRNESSFVTCSADKTIYLSSTISPSHRQLTGHTGEVNAVRWDPAGRLLASISDDCTVKLWNTSAKCVASAQSHTRGISCLSWSRTGPDTDHSGLPLMLATGSIDMTVRVWSVEDDNLHCVYTLKKHTHPVVVLAFAPDTHCDLLATGSYNRIFVWSVTDGTIVKTFRAPEGGINSLSWRSSGTQLVAGFSDGSVFIVELNIK